MKTINSLSGGKTSSYMAAHYPADYEIFALVTLEDTNCTPKDLGLVKKVSDKIGRQFIATAEDDKTLVVMLELEQKIGREITWVTGVSFDVLNKKRKALPNRMWRYCTTELKMRPIFDWWLQNISEKVQMNIGIRYDELERAEKIQNSFKGIVGSIGNRNKWEEIEWREAKFPLIENKIMHPSVISWAKSTGLQFPADSNCVGCFWKSINQLRKNWEDNKEKMEWFSEQESAGNRWKKEMKYKSILNVGLQKDFEFGEGAGCNAGFCTD
jgi:hypothetical protein